MTTRPNRAGVRVRAVGGYLLRLVPVFRARARGGWLSRSLSAPNRCPLSAPAVLPPAASTFRPLPIFRVCAVVIVPAVWPL